jgi:phage tail protein X
MLRAPWNAAVLNEMRTFPLGAHDDMIDALSDAFEALALPRVGVPAAESRANPAAAYGQQVTPHTLSIPAPAAYGGYRPR